MLSRRDLLIAGLAVGCQPAVPLRETELGSTLPDREIDEIVDPPPRHWVGDGFFVAGYFSRVRDAAQRLSPFVLLDYHPVHTYTPTDTPRGVGVHPHRGFETVSIAWEGSIAHHDSTGSGGVIGPGDVQWMTAGGGILHKEYHEREYAKRGGSFHMAQLWVNLPKVHKLHPPRYQPITSAQIAEVPLTQSAGVVRVIAGEYQGVAGPAQTFTPINLYDARVNAGKTLEMNFASHQTLAILVMKGSGVFNEVAQVATDQLVLFKRQGERVSFTADADTQLLVLNGDPIDEPVAKRGPFVMNTSEELDQAYSDFRSGKFGTLAD